MPVVSLFLIYFLIVNLVGCGGGNGGGVPTTQNAVKSSVESCSNGTPCMTPSQIQAEMLFIKIEQILPEYFSPSSATMTLQSGNDTIHYRVYANPYSTGLATYMGKLLYAVAGKWYVLASLDEANQALCGNACWSMTALQQALTKFNASIDGTVVDMVSISDTLVKLEASLATDDGSQGKTSEIGTLSDLLNLKVTSFLANVENMEKAETEIQLNTETGAEVSKSIVPLLAAAFVVKGLYSFGKKMKEYSDQMTSARKERDDAADDMMNNVPGAADKFNDARSKMREAGSNATQELATKVTTDLIFSPINPVTAAGVIIKETAGDLFQDGLKVISSTEECSGGYEASGCKIGVSKTKTSGASVVPGGKTSVVVGGKSSTRTVIAETEFEAGKTTEITRDDIPVTDATPDAVNKNDGVDPDPVVSKTLALSQAKSSEDDTSITYNVAAAVGGVTAPTTVTISIQNAATGGSTKTVSEDSTVIWSVTVLYDDATVTVTRNDTGESQSLTLPGKKCFDGTYSGVARTTFEAEDAICWDGVSVTVYVSGTRISGDASGTISGTSISGTYPKYGLSFSGVISGTGMSGHWSSPDGDCSGTFSLSKQ